MDDQRRPLLHQSLWKTWMWMPPVSRWIATQVYKAEIQNNLLFELQNQCLCIPQRENWAKALVRSTGFKNEAKSFSKLAAGSSSKEGFNEFRPVRCLQHPSTQTGWNWWKKSQINFHDWFISGLKWDQCFISMVSVSQSQITTTWGMVGDGWVCPPHPGDLGSWTEMMDLVHRKIGQLARWYTWLADSLFPPWPNRVICMNRLTTACCKGHLEAKLVMLVFNKGKNTSHICTYKRPAVLYLFRSKTHAVSGGQGFEHFADHAKSLRRWRSPGGTV